jgi:AhpD family alkylhydroperoxidase
VTRFPIHTPDTATGKAAELLTGIVARNGTAGSMVRTMAGSPTVLGGYLDLSRAMKRSRLAWAVSERISLVVESRLGCALCLPAHTEAARSIGIDDSEIELAKQGTSADPVLAPILAFGQRVHQAPASITAAEIDVLRGLGYRDRDLMDVVALVSLNVLTGTFNLVAGLEPHAAVAA